MREGLRNNAINSTLVVLFFLVATAHAANGNFAISEADLYLWICMSVILAASFIGIAYMAAKAFELQVLEGWVKIELRELAASFVIALLCTSLLISVNSASQFLSGENGSTNVIDAARSFLKNEVYADGQKLYMLLAGAYFNIARVSSYSYTAGVSVGFVSASTFASPGAGLSPLLSEISQAMDSVSNFMLLAAAQSAFLLFFQSAGMYMLPLGIFLRSFSLTRKLGAVLLAAVIASVVIYPSAMFVSKEIYDTYRPGLLDSINNVRVAPAGNPPAASLVCNPYMQTFVASPIPYLGGENGWYTTICVPLCWVVPGACNSVCFNVIRVMYTLVKSTFPITMYYAVLLPYAGNLGSFNSGLENYYNPLEQYALPSTVQYSVLSIVVFLIPLIIAVVLLRNLAVTFGGEPQLYGLSKLM